MPAVLTYTYKVNIEIQQNSFSLQVFVWRNPYVSPPRLLIPFANAKATKALHTLRAMKFEMIFEIDFVAPP